MYRKELGPRELRYLNALEELLQVEAVETKSVLVQCSNIIASALETDKTDVFLFHPASAMLVAEGTSTTPLGQLQKALAMDRLQVANGGRHVEVFESGEPFLTGHADLDPKVLPGVKDAMRIRSMVAVPLDVNGERRGVLSATSLEEDAYSEDALIFMGAAARWVGAVIHRAELVEQVTQEAARQARQVVAEELIRIIAHDFRGHLATIMGRSYLIRRRAEREKRDADIADADKLLKAIHYLRAMTDNLLDEARLNQGTFTLHREQVDISQLVHGAVEVMQLPERNLAFRGGEGCYAFIDAARVRQAVENLLTNAFKHTPEGTPVRVSVEEEEYRGHPCIIIAVQDDGPGIPPERLASLFERFQHGSPVGGLGLGLYLARAIAEAHGGELRVESTPGKGSCFSLLLPVLSNEEM